MSEKKESKLHSNHEKWIPFQNNEIGEMNSIYTELMLKFRNSFEEQELNKFVDTHSEVFFQKLNIMASNNSKFEYSDHLEDGREFAYQLKTITEIHLQNIEKNIKVSEHLNQITSLKSNLKYQLQNILISFSNLEKKSNFPTNKNEFYKIFDESCLMADKYLKIISKMKQFEINFANNEEEFQKKLVDFEISDTNFEITNNLAMNCQSFLHNFDSVVNSFIETSPKMNSKEIVF